MSSWHNTCTVQVEAMFGISRRCDNISSNIDENIYNDDIKLTALRKPWISLMNIVQIVLKQIKTPTNRRETSYITYSGSSTPSARWDQHQMSTETW